MKWDFPGAEKFTKRHKALTDLFPWLSLEDLDVILKVAHHLQSTHKNPLFNMSKEEVEKLKPRKRSTNLIAFPETDEDVAALKKAILTPDFMAWYRSKGYKYDLDKEWEAFEGNMRLRRKKFVGRDLHFSTYRGFQNWLNSPYEHNMMTNKARREDVVSDDSEASKVILRARELKAEAMKTSEATGGKKHWMTFYIGLLEAEGIDAEVVKGKV